MCVRMPWAAFLSALDRAVGQLAGPAIAAFFRFLARVSSRGAWRAKETNIDAARSARQFVPRVFPASLRSFHSLPRDWGSDRNSVAPWTTSGCAYGCVSGDGRSDSHSPRPWGRWREGVAAESLRLPAGQGENLVRAHPASDARSNGVVVRHHAMEWNPGSASANRNCPGPDPLRGVLHQRFCRRIGLVRIRNRLDAGTVGCGSGQHYGGIRLGRFPLRGLVAGSPLAGMDRLVVSLDGGVARSHRLALQQRR